MQHRESLCQILLIGLLILIKSSHQKHVNEKDEKLISKIANTNKTSSYQNQKQILSQTIEFNFPIFGQQQEQPNELENNNVPLPPPPPPLLPPQPSSPLLPPVHKPNFPFIYPSASSVHLNEYVTTNYNNNNDETQTETNNENSKNLILY